MRSVSDDGCQCISNLCVANLYTKKSTICSLMEEWFYKDSSHSSVGGYPGKRKDLPWIMYYRDAFTT